MNKKGQELSVGTLILIVLGIVLLVLLILGFSLGWSNLWEKINIFSSSTSLESVAQKCSLAATSNSLVSYCETFSQATVDGKKLYINCEYKKLNLDKTLTCSGTPRVETKCVELLKEKFKGQYDDNLNSETEYRTACEKSDIMVNDRACAPEFCARDKIDFSKDIAKKVSPILTK